MKKMMFAAAIAQEKRNDMSTQGMNTLARERDYQAISERLSRMEPQQAARWLSLQEEELRFAVACKMQPQQAEQIFRCQQEQTTQGGYLHTGQGGYLHTGAFTLAKNRIFWLMALMVSGMITGSILAKYESAFAAVPMLVTFIPMLTDTGGNAGSQSSTMVIRAMATGEVHFRDLFVVLWKEIRVGVLAGAMLTDTGGNAGSQSSTMVIRAMATGEVHFRDLFVVLWKEIRVGVLAGAVLSAVNFLRLLLTTPHSAEIALTVSLAMFLTVVMAKTIGSLLPLVAGLVKCDPAIMAAPLITTIVDAFALIMYFKIAQLVLGL